MQEIEDLFKDESNSINSKEYRREVHKYLKDLNFDEGLNEFKNELFDLKKDFLEIKPKEDIVDWIYNHIVIPQQQSTRAGNMKLSVFQREIANFITSKQTKFVCLKGVQIGYSKVLKAIYAYVVSQLAKNVSVVFPIKQDVKRFWKDEISELATDVDPIRKIVRDIERGTAQDTQSEQRFINGVRTYFRAAFNEDDLQGYTSWLQLLDEIDRPGWLPRGDSQGDKIKQAMLRGTNFEDSKAVLGSTPGNRHNSLIWKHWLMSDQRRLQVKCPHCQTEQELRWDVTGKERWGFKWDLDEDGLVEKAYYQCDSRHGCRIDEHDKEKMIDEGVYKSSTKATEPGTVGIHAPSWLSMAPQASWKYLAQEWILAKDDLELMRTFYNFRMAEPWDDFQSETLNNSGIKSLRTAYPAEVPDDVVVLTIGGDDQTNKEGSIYEKMASREISVVGWTADKSPRLIGHWVIPGEVGDRDADEAYKFFIDRPYYKRDGTRLLIQAVAMDMGGHHAKETQIFANKFPRNRNVFAIRGASTRKGKREKDGIWPKSVQTARKGRSKLVFHTICSQTAKDRVGELLTREGGRSPQFPQSMPNDYFDKLLCEQRTIQPENGGYWWNPKKGERAEEEWMCLVYAYVALEGLRERHSKWRDLNLAAKRMKVSMPDEIVDEETGELGYKGEDRSIPALQFSSPDLIPKLVLDHMKFKNLDKDQDENKASTKPVKKAEKNTVSSEFGQVDTSQVQKQKPKRKRKQGWKSSAQRRRW